jgi:hypothetical protein
MKKAILILAAGLAKRTRVFVVLTALLASITASQAVPMLQLNVTQNQWFFEVAVTPVDPPASPLEMILLDGNVYKLPGPSMSAAFVYQGTVNDLPQTSVGEHTFTHVYSGGIELSASFTIAQPTIPKPVPDGGASSAALLGLGVLGLAGVRRHFSSLS